MRAVIYTRVSTKGQEDGFSIDAQEKRCKAWLEGNNPEANLIDIYHEVGSGGSVDGRPVYKEMIQDMLDDKWDILVFYKLDRLHRNMKNSADFFESLKEHDKQFVSISENIDTTSPGGEMLYYMLMAFAQMERENIRMRVRMGMTEAKTAGLHLGRPPYGYNMISETDDKGNRTARGRLEINQDEASTVKKIFEMHEVGLKISEICFELVKLGIKTRQNKPMWHRETVKKLIQREDLYRYGSVEIDGKMRKGVHPIILNGGEEE